MYTHTHTYTSHWRFADEIIEENVVPRKSLSKFQYNIYVCQKITYTYAKQSMKLFVKWISLFCRMAYE